MKLPKPVLTVGDLGLDEVVFTWEEPGTGQQLTFAVSMLARLCKALRVEVVALHIDREYAESVARGLEAHRLAYLSEHTNWEPIICCLMPDGTALVVDGNHRYYIAAADLGRTEILAYLVNQDIWEQVLVDLPKTNIDDLVTGWSGL